LLATAALAALATWLVARRIAPERSKPKVASFEIGDVAPWSPLEVAQLAVSSDGTRIVYRSLEGLTQRSLQRADQVQARVEGECPFFSPDGESIGFFGGRGLTRVSVRGGAPTVIANVGSDTWRQLGGSWGPDYIVFATTLGLHRVAAGGGEVELLLSPDPDRNELSLALPEILPGGQTVLFTVVPRDPKAAYRVAALDLDSRERKTIVTDGAGARYAPTGHLVYVARGRLQAVAFDVDTLETSGDPQTVLDAEVAGANFELSDNGTLVYQPAMPPEGAAIPVWVDRDGRQEPIPATAGGWIYPRISPDGKRVAFDRWPAEGRDIYIWDFERQSLSRLTDDPGEDVLPHWSADGSRIFFSSNRTRAAFNLYSRVADGTGKDELVFESPLTQMLFGLTPDGAQLLVEQGSDIFSVDVEEPRQARALLATEAGEWNPSVSPDGRWVAYQSDDEGQPEVFVGPFPEMDKRRWKISAGGGEAPRWSSKGDEIFFRGPSGNMMAAQVTLTPTFAPGKVTELFSNPSSAEFIGGRKYDVSLDGRFLMVKEAPRTRRDRLVVVMNWFEELKAKVPVR
jgi:serine/threonine-protein kinase